MKPACLVAIAGPLLGARIEVGDLPITIGRSSEVEITVPSSGVSRQHCRIFRDDSTFHIEDLGSTNKTYVNGEPITRSRLRDADRIKVGDCILKFFDEGSVEADYQKQLVDLAVLDELTRLPNRRQFLAQLQQEMNEADRTKSSLALIIADLDFFKAVNDRFGHLSGDTVLRRFAEIVALSMPENALAGRLGGEEFGFVLPDTDIESAKNLAEQWRKDFGDTSHSLQRGTDDVPFELKVTASFGVSILIRGMTSPGEFLRQSDLKLLEAKTAGRNRVCA